MSDPALAELWEAQLDRVWSISRLLLDEEDAIALCASLRQDRHGAREALMGSLRERLGDALDAAPLSGIPPLEDESAELGTELPEDARERLAEAVAAAAPRLRIVFAFHLFDEVDPALDADAVASAVAWVRERCSREVGVDLDDDVLVDLLSREAPGNLGWPVDEAPEEDAAWAQALGLGLAALFVGLLLMAGG